MLQEYRKPSIEVLGEVREVTAATAGGPLSDLVQGIINIIKPPEGSEGSS